ncbi:MAG: restriction endonuclease subunit S [Methanofastidiosum sp.]|nr:restriction endonuclease subunit S [Methanofastidiosum sp.]
MNGELPKGWVWTSLENMTDIVLGQSPPSSTYNEDKFGLPFYQGKSEFGLIYPIPTKWCSSPKKIAEEGDILISVRAPVGPTNICPKKSCIGRGLAAIRGLGNINNKFILYLLRNSEEQFRNKATGTTFEAITGNVLRNFEVPLPPLAEQQRIVNKIEELFTNLDKGIESLEQVKYKLKIYRQAILKYAMEGKLTEKWREENKDKIEPASVLLDKMGQQIKTDNINEDISAEKNMLSKIPLNWICSKLGNITLFHQYGWTTRAVDKGTLHLLRTTDITSGRIDWDSVPYCEEEPENVEKYLLKDGDIVISRAGSVGYSYLIKNPPQKSIFASYLIRFRPLINGTFLSYFLRSPIYWNAISEKSIGIAIPNVNASKLKQINVPIPSLEEQKIIVEHIEQLFSLADYIEETVDSKLEQSKTLRQSILKKAFEGKLVPQDPNDEPAELLLEKIKKQRLNKEELVQEKLV